MPRYQVKPDRTVEHNNQCYFEGDVVEFASEFGAYHEPNIVPYVVPESIESAVDVESIAFDDEEETDQDEEETDQEEEKSPSDTIRLFESPSDTIRLFGID